MTYEIFWTPRALEQLQFWQKNKSEKIEKIKMLCQSICSSSQFGLGKPEPLKFFKENVWSQKIDQEHRLVYEVKKDSTIFTLQWRYHY